MPMPQLKAKLSTSMSKIGIMSAATFTLEQTYARVGFLQSGSAWGKERQQSCARPASKEKKRNLFAFFEPDRASEGIFSKPFVSKRVINMCPFSTRRTRLELQIYRGGRL